MASHNTPADPLAKGTFATAKQAWSDLFIWKQRVVVVDEDGETYTEWQNPPPLRNPISLFRMLSARDWLYFLTGFFAWTADAFDFHALSIQQTKFSRYYNRSKTDISTAITLTLLLRSVGAAVFGLLGDRFGRKWPMVANMIILGKFFFFASVQHLGELRTDFGLQDSCKLPPFTPSPSSSSSVSGPSLVCSWVVCTATQWPWPSRTAREFSPNSQTPTTWIPP